MSRDVVKRCTRSMCL